jgi:hypothetical protein
MKKSPAKPNNLHLMKPLDQNTSSTKSSSPGKRGKGRRGGSTMSYKEHFDNYDKMVTKNVNNQPMPQYKDVVDGNESDEEYQPKDSDIVKNLFDTTSMPIPYHEPPSVLIAPHFFTKGNQPQRPPDTAKASSVQDFILSVQKSKEPTALKHSGSTSDVHSLQRQQQPYHHVHQLYHTEPSQIYNNFHHPSEPYHMDDNYTPRSFSPPAHLLSPPRMHQQHPVVMQPLPHHYHPQQQPHPHHHHQKSFSIGGGETVPQQQQYTTETENLRVVNHTGVAITAPSNPMTEEQLLASLMPNSTPDAHLEKKEEKKNERYAGGMWTSSPPPSSLPVPKFKNVQKK